MQAIKENTLPKHSTISAVVKVGRFPDNSDHMFVRPKLIFASKYEEKDKAPAVIVGAEFQLGYRTGDNSKLTDEEKKALGQVGLWHAWSYFREYFHSQLARMGLPPMLLPPLALPEVVSIAGQLKKNRPPR